MQAYNRKKQQEADIVLLEAASIASLFQPDFSESESQPDPIDDAPHPTAQNEALAEQNLALKRKLREAVAVGNGCYRALQRERVEADKADEAIKRLKFHLLLEGNTLQKLRDNPRGVRLGRTPEESQAFVAEKERKKKEDEHQRQFIIEQDLKRKLAFRHSYEMLAEERAKVNKEQARRVRAIFAPKTKEEEEARALSIAEWYRRKQALRDLLKPQGTPAGAAQRRQDRQQGLLPSTAQDPPAARDAREQDLEQSHAGYGGHDARSDGECDGPGGVLR